MNTFKQASHVSGSISAAVTTLVLRASTTCFKKRYACQNHLNLLFMNLYLKVCIRLSHFTLATSVVLHNKQEYFILQ